MKEIIKITVGLFLLLAVPVDMQGQLLFTTNNNVITVTGYSGSAGALTIPSVTNGYPVTIIAANAFNSLTSLTAVTIPTSITNLGQSAFFDCTGLKSVSLTSGDSGMAGQTSGCRRA